MRQHSSLTDSSMLPDQADNFNRFAEDSANHGGILTLFTTETVSSMRIFEEIE